MYNKRLKTFETSRLWCVFKNTRLSEDVRCQTQLRDAPTRWTGYAHGICWHCSTSLILILRVVFEVCCSVIREAATAAARWQETDHMLETPQWMSESQERSPGTGQITILTVSEAVWENVLFQCGRGKQSCQPGGPGPYNLLPERGPGKQDRE